MGVDGKKNSTVPPLPAPTETETTLDNETPTATELATDVSRATDNKSSYSLPEDGTPVTFKTRGHRYQHSQTSLLIEYFEASKGKDGSGSVDSRKPSVRVRLTPSSKSRRSGGSERDHIQITETKSRKTTTRRRTTSPGGGTRLEHDTLSALDPEDAKSLSSYASATEESNVSRNPIDIEIDRTGNVRRRRPASPLIPAADSSAGYHGAAMSAMSDISAIPTDSFLDGSGPTTSFSRSEVKRNRSKSPSRARDVIGGAAAGLAAAMAADRLRNKKRESRDEDIVVSKSRDKDRSERRKSSKSRSSSVSEKDRHAGGSKTPRKRSDGKYTQESLLSAADTSVLSQSNLSPSHRSYDQQSMRSATSKASSINNPKLLETVEDAIRRLILPELNALKREQSKHKTRRDSTASSATSASRDDYASDRRRSTGTEKNVDRESIKKERRDREARHDFDYSPSQSGVSQLSVNESIHDVEQIPKRSSDRLPAAAVGAAAGALATAAVMHEVSGSDDKRTRRRRRAELRSRASDQNQREDYESSELSVLDPPMPLMSDVGTAMSGMTRTSILSADTDRPHSAGDERTPVQEVTRGVLSESSSPTPTRTPAMTLQDGLGTQHANISHGDLKALPRRRTGDFVEEELDDQEHEQGAPMPPQQEYEEDDYSQHEREGPNYTQSGAYDYYNTQDVPPPLKYVPYQPERRGLSPIPSVSGYTEGGSEGPNRDSRVIHTSGSMSSPEKHDDIPPSPSSVPSNIMSRGFGDDNRSVGSLGIDYRHSGYNDGSEISRAESGQAVRAVGANPQLVHPPGIDALESNVASLVDGSMLDGSVLTGDSLGYRNQVHSPHHSVGLREEQMSQGHAAPFKRSVESYHGQQSQGQFVEERQENDTPVSGSQRSREFADEYDIDEYGRKVPVSRSKQRHSPTASEAAITLPALTAAAAAIKAAQGHGKHDSAGDDEFVGAGVQRNKSFKERAMNATGPLGPAGQNADLMLDEYDQPKMDFRAMPDFNNPMPDGHWHDEESVVSAPDQERYGDVTPRQQTPVSRGVTPREHYEGHGSHSVHGIGLPEVAAAAAIGTVAGMASASNASHSRQPSQDQEWHRTSEDRKRDTLLTNPYEGTSPVVNLPGLGDNLIHAQHDYNGPQYGNEYAIRSPLGHNPDEGYISQGPNKTPDIQGGGKSQGVNFDQQHNQVAVHDPFFDPKHTRHLSGMSHGMDSPFYDASTGGGIERIESKDIVALMQHLMVRDAQRSARDTEILVTLVKAAAEMRNSFDDIKRMLADTEDVIITEVKENTEKTVTRAIGGPRPFPGSGTRSLQGAGSQSGTMTLDDFQAKKANIFRRALKGLSGKGVNDLGRIEGMLNHLLTEVDVLKAQTAPGTTIASNHEEQSYDNFQPEGAYEQDRGYEPEGNAGTSTASHASQSGHLSIPQSRGASAKLGYDRKFSDHRISTVPEDNEDDFYEQEDALSHHSHNGNPDMLMTPAIEPQRGGSVPLATPPRTAATAQASMSNEHTPRTEKGKKASWFGIPKISRWSETTTSSVAQAFRRNKKNDDDGHYQSPPSRSGSNFAGYDDDYGRTDPYGEDKLHSGFSEQDLAHDDDAHSIQQSPGPEDMQPPPPLGMAGNYRMTPEDPKYKVHRDSLNLQHPQPRPGQTDLFKATLESQAHEFDSPMSPRSAEWAGSATSLHRLPRNANRDSYGSTADQGGHQQYWTSSPAAANMMATSGPPRPPKEPLDRSGSPTGLSRATPPKSNRISKLQKGSPLPYHSVESGYGTMTLGAPSNSYVSHTHTNSRDSHNQSPRLENRNLSGALGIPARRPSGPRAMTPKSMDSQDGDAERRRKRG